MTALDRVPGNLNFLAQLGFQFQVKKLPHVNFFIQEISIPGLSVPSISQGTPFTAIKIPGDHVNFEELFISFKVDENLQNYLEMFQWIRDYAYDKNYDQYSTIMNQPRWTGNGIYSDISVLVLNSASVPKYEFTFRDAFPTSLSKLDFHHNTSDVEYLSCHASFAYTLFDLQAL